MRFTKKGNRHAGPVVLQVQDVQKEMLFMFWELKLVEGEGLSWPVICSTSLRKVWKRKMKNPMFSVDMVYDIQNWMALFAVKKFC